MPKLNLWSGLIQERRLRDVLAQSVAVWAPEKINDQLDALAREAGAPSSNESQTPLSAEEFERMLGAAKRD